MKLDSDKFNNTKVGDVLVCPKTGARIERWPGGWLLKGNNANGMYDETPTESQIKEFFRDYDMDKASHL